MIRAILFDVDGTLVDTNDLHAAAWSEAFRHFGVELPYQTVRDQIGKGGDNLLPALLPPELVKTSQTEIEEYRSTLFRRDYMRSARPFPGVRTLFERIRGDQRRIVLASSAKQEELHFFIELLGVGDLVDATTSQDDVEHSKPCPDIFAAALAKASVEPGEAVVVGDTPYDMEAAGKLGIRAIGFRCGGFPDGVLRGAGAEALFDGCEDLLARYESSPLA